MPVKSGARVLNILTVLTTRNTGLEKKENFDGDI
jgi:hypothetical protein